MTADASLLAFIAHARQKGLDHATIRMMLLGNGWKEKEILRALSAQELDMPVPLPPDTGGAREAFFHLLSFGFFYGTAISVILLFFTYVNRIFPDLALEYMQPTDADLSQIRGSMATIVVAFPLLLWVTRGILREMAHHPERAVSGIRRWLTYLTLLVASSAIVGTLITLVYSMLEGELSVRFVLKVLWVLAVAGLTFTYYLLALRMDPARGGTRNLHRTFAWVASGIVCVILVWGAVYVGSPLQERTRRIDQQRVSDLRAIQNEIMNIVYRGLPYDAGQPVARPLPQTLEELQANATYMRIRTMDPETGELYRYTVLAPDRFELCATFTTAEDAVYDVFWNHPAGFHCFAFDVTERQK